MPISNGKNCICISGYLLWDTSESELMLKQKDEDCDFYYTNPLINIINDYIEYDSKDLGDGSLPKTIRRDDEGLGTKTMTVPNCSIHAYFTESECTTEDATQEFLGFMYGGEYYTHGRYVGYSEWTITGFCVDTFTIGGHDLISELKSHDGQYVNMIIEF